MAKKALIFGSFVQDHAWLTDSFPVIGETRKAKSFTTGPGGKGFNQAIAAHRQGADVRFLGAIGCDHLGASAQAFAAAENLKCYWEIVDGPTASSSIVIDAQGRNLIVVDLAANDRFSPERLKAHADLFKDRDILLTQLENPLESVAVALQMAKQLGMITILNPAPMHAGLRAEHLQHCDYLTPNETEFALLHRALFDREIDPEALAGLSDEQLNDLCEPVPVDHIIITLGKFGCFVHSKSATGRSKAFRIKAENVVAIDTTGAGDAFSGGLVAAMALNIEQPLAEHARHANRVAALSTEKLGTAPAMPEYLAVNQRFLPDRNT